MPGKASSSDLDGEVEATPARAIPRNPVQAGLLEILEQPEFKVSGTTLAFRVVNEEHRRFEFTLYFHDSLGWIVDQM